MNFDFYQNTAPDSSPINIMADELKYKEITIKLCNKRLDLEKKTKDPAISPTEKEETAIKLIELKSSMATFGVSEVDYQAFLEKNSKSTEAHGAKVALLIEPD